LARGLSRPWPAHLAPGAEDICTYRERCQRRVRTRESQPVNPRQNFYVIPPPPGVVGPVPHIPELEKKFRMSNLRISFPGIADIRILYLRITNIRISDLRVTDQTYRYENSDRRLSYLQILDLRISNFWISYLPILDLRISNFWISYL
jgi:hypothetical protein